MKISKGEYGYIKEQKKTQLLYSIGSLILIVTFNVLSTFILDYSKLFTLISILFVLPFAQRFVKLILLIRYKENSRLKDTRLNTATDNLKALYSLIMTAGNRTIYFDSIILSDKEVILLKLDIKGKTDGKDKIEWARKLFQITGHKVKVSFFNDLAELLKYIQNNSIDFSRLNTDKQTELERIVLSYTI